jgi:hypothetical protein
VDERAISRDCVAWPNGERHRLNLHSSPGRALRIRAPFSAIGNSIAGSDTRLFEIKQRLGAIRKVFVKHWLITGA